MNLDKLFEMQKVLDERIVREKGLEGRDTLPEKILALQVELGECANEWRRFKFWSEDREPKTLVRIDCEVCTGTGIGTNFLKNCPSCKGSGKWKTNPLLEEYVDCLHFILSIGLEHEFNEMLPLSIESITCVDITRQFTMLMRTDWEIYEEGDGAYYHEGLELFLGLGEMLGFTWDQIESAYYAKNEINHVRQAEGY